MCGGSIFDFVECWLKVKGCVLCKCLDKMFFLKSVLLVLLGSGGKMCVVENGNDVGVLVD